MSAVVRMSMAASIVRLWRSRSAWLTTADIFIIMLALSLPWSTSLVAIFAAAVLVSVARFLDIRAFLQLLRQPICILAIAVFALALVGTLWSDAPWGARLRGVAPTVKLLMLPVLFYHFERSARGVQVFTAFLISCVVLTGMSWIVELNPGLVHNSEIEHGVPVHNYIDQSQEFTLCAVALAYPIISLLRAKKIVPALLLFAVCLSFVINMIFVIVSRTALVTMPVLLALFALLHLKRRTAVIILCMTAVLAGLAWTTSPALRRITESFSSDYHRYKQQNTATSLGLRLEFWEKSLRFFADAPIVGHGTGSTRGLFERAAVGRAGGAAAEIIDNPHNQTLNVAVQWGVVGIVVLYAMWLSHLLLFRSDGLMAWIGLLVVLQNIFSSLFNSHLFDFQEGWIYVLGVGVAGGTVLRTRSRASTSEPENPCMDGGWHAPAR